MSVRISTGGLENRLGVAPAKLKRVIRNSLNDTVRELREETPGILRHVVDRPNRFTTNKNVLLYSKADYSQGDNMRAGMKFAPLQNKYLSPNEFGGISKNLNNPIRSDAFDQSGNIVKKFFRSSSAKSRLFSQQHTVRLPTGGRVKVRKYFEGKPHGGFRFSGLFFRDPDGKLSRLSMYVKRRRYREKFGIRREWGRIGPGILERHVRAQAARPENQI